MCVGVCVCVCVCVCSVCGGGGLRAVHSTQPVLTVVCLQHSGCGQSQTLLRLSSPAFTTTKQTAILIEWLNTNTIVVL